MEKDNSTSNENLHENHRQRVYDRLQSDGLDSFYDHEVLEFILFHTVPRRDTNPIAHRLIKEFGSLSAVMDADIKSLQSIQGVSYKSAVLINSLPQLLRRYDLARLEEKSPVDSFEKAAKYAKALFKGENKEIFYVLCLDAKNRLIKAEKLKEGSATELIINPRAVVVAATKHESAAVILMHNHPGGSARPSFDDIAGTKKTALALGVIGIPLLDHIISAKGEVLSFKREGLMADIIKSAATKIENVKSYT